MRVYLKKENKGSTIPLVVMMIIFLLFPVNAFIIFLKNGGKIADTLLIIGNMLPFVVLVSIFGLFLLFFFIKPPKKYKVILIKKKLEEYNGMQITNMAFSIQEENSKDDENISIDYKCYTKGENNLTIGYSYLLKIRQFGNIPKFVEEINYLSEGTKNNYKSKNITFSKIIFGICIPVILILAGICFYEIYKTKDYVKTTAIVTKNIEEYNNRYVEVKYGNYTNKYKVYTFFMKEVGMYTTIYYSNEDPYLIRDKFLLTNIIIVIGVLSGILIGTIIYTNKSSNVKVSEM